MRNISDELCSEHNLSVVEFKLYVGKPKKQVSIMIVLKKLLEGQLARQSV